MSDWIQYHIFTDVNIIFFVGVPHLATYIFLNYQPEPELGAGMAFAPFPSSILRQDSIPQPLNQ